MPRSEYLVEIETAECPEPWVVERITVFASHAEAAQELAVQTVEDRGATWSHRYVKSVRRVQPAPSLAATCARRFGHFAHSQFNPNSQKSWNVADKLWRAAIMARDANETELSERQRHEQQDESRQRWSPYDRDTGIPKHGEI